MTTPRSPVTALARRALRLGLLAALGAGACDSGSDDAPESAADARPASFDAEAARGDAGRFDDAEATPTGGDLTRPDASGPPADAVADAAGPDVTGAPPPPDAHPRFRFAIAAADRSKMMTTPVFHVDHDTLDHPEAPATCTNFEGAHFPFCYDGHRGSDFMLGGGFSTMDNGSAEVVAAAGGIVEEAVDGHYDRCHGSAATLEVTCDGHEMRANFVRLRHANGWASLYYHLKRGSVAVSVGDRVRCGERLGLVGSSGRSTLPHLHFQVEDPAGEVVDPFAGPESQPDSLFTEQAAADARPGGECDPAWTSPAP